MQYSISNLNAFILIISIGYSLYYYIDNDQSNTDNYDNKNNKSGNDLKDKNNSPIQLISQLKGYYYINPILNNLNLGAFITDENIIIKKIKFTVNNITLSSYLSITISILTIIILMFLFIPQE